jgi:hypothetical protein
VCRRRVGENAFISRMEKPMHPPVVAVVKISRKRWFELCGLCVLSVRNGITQGTWRAQRALSFRFAKERRAIETSFP